MKIDKITEDYRKRVFQMMKTFYSSPAVHTNGSDEIFNNDISACINGSPYLEGYVFLEGENLLGYGMLAKSFSTEFGKPCVWIEDIYIKPEFRGQGIGGDFINFVFESYPSAVIRLEAEEENERAVAVYKKHGFTTLPYLEMIKL